MRGRFRPFFTLQNIGVNLKIKLPLSFHRRRAPKKIAEKFPESPARGFSSQSPHKTGTHRRKTSTHRHIEPPCVAAKTCTSPQSTSPQKRRSQPPKTAVRNRKKTAAKRRAFCDFPKLEKSFKRSKDAEFIPQKAAKTPLSIPPAFPDRIERIFVPLHALRLGEGALHCRALPHISTSCRMPPRVAAQRIPTQCRLARHFLRLPPRPPTAAAGKPFPKREPFSPKNAAARLKMKFWCCKRDKEQFH